MVTNQQVGDFSFGRRAPNMTPVDCLAQATFVIYGPDMEVCLFNIMHVLTAT